MMWGRNFVRLISKHFLIFASEIYGRKNVSSLNSIKNMVDFKIQSKSIQTSATYVKDNFKVDVTYLQDKEATLENISMTIYKGDGIYAGNVNAGRADDGSLQFSFSSISQDDLAAVTAIVNEINDAISASVVSAAVETADSSGNEAQQQQEEKEI